MNLSNKKFSPGPWNVRQWRGRADYDLAVVDSDGIVIAEIVDLVNDSKNAAMLASAREMYEVLQTMYDAMLDVVHRAALPDDALTAADEALEKAEKAMKKARGEEE